MSNRLKAVVENLCYKVIKTRLIKLIKYLLITYTQKGLPVAIDTMTLVIQINTIRAWLSCMLKQFYSINIYVLFVILELKD